MNKSVTILIPCYNGQNYLKRCLDSCVNQTYQNLKILVVNDGSTDESQKIIEEYMSKYPNINLINQTNQGLSETRNILIQNCFTTYGYFVDVDDWIDQDCIEYFVKNSDDYDLVIGRSFISKKNKNKNFWINNKITKKTNNESYLVNNDCFCWNVLFKTEYFKQFQFLKSAAFFEDIGLMSYVIYKTKKIKFILEPKYHYWINHNSISRSKMNYKKIEDFYKQLEYFYNLIEHEKFINYPRAINDQLAFNHCIFFTYIEFKSDISKKDQKLFKQKLKNLELNHQKIKFPKRWWKFWYFLFYRLSGY